VPLLGLAVVPQHLKRLAMMERLSGHPADAVRRLAALAVVTPEDADRLSTRLKLSTHEWTSLMDVGRLWRQVSPHLDERVLRRLLYCEGQDAVLAASFVARARHDVGLDDAGWTAVMRAVKTLDVPTFPVRGRDVLDRGLTAGPMVGAVLGRLEAWWVAADFTGDREVLLARLDADLAVAEPD
jgi:poly(A) polymerase